MLATPKLAPPHGILTATSHFSQGKTTARCLTSGRERFTVSARRFGVRTAILIVAAGLVTFLASFFGPAALAGKQPGPNGEPGVTRGDLRGVNFVENCRFSHSAADDPIVFPGKAGASHDHTFVGNRSTSAFSTYASLRRSGTSCRRAEDTAGYWVPTLLQNATPLFPRSATIYYRRGTLAPITTFPNNLRMIAGDATATTPQGMRRLGPGWFRPRRGTGRRAPRWRCPARS